MAFLEGRHALHQPGGRLCSEEGVRVRSLQTSAESHRGPTPESQVRVVLQPMLPWRALHTDHTAPFCSTLELWPKTLLLQLQACRKQGLSFPSSCSFKLLLKLHLLTAVCLLFLVCFPSWGKMAMNQPVGKTIAQFHVTGRRARKRDLITPGIRWHRDTLPPPY